MGKRKKNNSVHGKNSRNQEVLLQQFAKQLSHKLYRAQLDFRHGRLKLDRDELNVLATILVDFAIDVHSEIGIWAAYEQFNVETFGEPLPVTGGGDDGNAGVDRIRHLLWKLSPQLFPGIAIAPAHHDMSRIANVAWAFLEKKLRSFPRDAGIPQILKTANEFGWDVKRKLVWLGTKSYLFRILFQDYIAKHIKEIESEPDEYSRRNRLIDHTEDFLCQKCTTWSGLGAIDILAGVLDIDDRQHAEICGWYERHYSIYRLDNVKRDCIDAVNLVIDHPYRIRHDRDFTRFTNKKGWFVLGSVVPWKSEWYWSGTQRVFPPEAHASIKEFSRQLKRKSSIVCRYWPEREKLVRDRQKVNTHRMLEYFGSDLKIYPDGLSMAADWEREIKSAWEAYPADTRADVAKRHGLRKGRPEINILPYLLEHKDGLAVFINPDEGKEIASYSRAFIRAMEKKGCGLDDDDSDVVRGWIRSDSISPAFIRRMLTEYGGEESIKAVYMLNGSNREYCLEYLLRCHKGHYYRKRYPPLSIIDE